MGWLFTDSDARTMDEAANTAATELAQLILENEAAVVLVADWWRRHYLGAGHKRMGRVLVKFGVRQVRDKA